MGDNDVLMHFTSSYARIKKVGDDFFTLTIRDRFRQIDEEIDGPKLLAMLARESVVNEKGEPISPTDILSRFDLESVSHEITVSLIERVA
jgi:hypothetical protein